MRDAPMALRLYSGEGSPLPTTSLEKCDQGKIFSTRAPPRTKEANQLANSQNVERLWMAVIPRFTSTGPATRGVFKIRFVKD